MSAALPALQVTETVCWADNCLLMAKKEPLPHHTRKDVLQEDEVEILLDFQITETFS